MMRHTLGWSRRMASPASRRRRSTELRSVAALGAKTLMATSLPAATSRARYTYDLPPSPGFLSTGYPVSRTCPLGVGARWGRGPRGGWGWGGVRTPVPPLGDAAAADG